MPPTADQILTATQMRAAEQALIDAETSVDDLMQRAGRGAADWIWRVAAGRTVTVLCGPGNNGGDGWVIAEALRERGGKVRAMTAAEPRTEAARKGRSLYSGEVLDRDATAYGEILVDCLFGSGLARPLADADVALLKRLALSHSQRIAIDLPSGIDTDTGAALNEGLPDWSLTLALGAWKPAHFLMPGAATMGELRLVEIGIGSVSGAGKMMDQPKLTAPAPDAHKYRRGLLGVIAGAMPGAAVLAARAAQHAGAGYVKLLGEIDDAGADLVVDHSPIAMEDKRFTTLLIGPGLGRDEHAGQRLLAALATGKPLVVDADGLSPFAALRVTGRTAPIIATPHEGEFDQLEGALLRRKGTGSKAERVRTLAEASELIIVAKGPDTVIAAPDGRLVFAPRASSWLSTAGTGDVLAGCIASRLATGAEPFTAACEGVWLHGEAARLAGPAFTAGALAAAVREAYAAAL